MAQWNVRNPAVKRIVQELKEIQRDDDPDILAEAIEDNIFEWHFVIRGAWDTEFEGGIYHGRILMPAEYPFKPPAFVMLTPSGRFETGTKICLSISSHHPESWQPSWSVRSALVALIAFMQTPGNGALGSLDHPTEARRQMAAESRSRPPEYGSAERQQLIAAMHQRMLDLEERSRQLGKQEQPPADATAALPAASVREAAAPAGEAAGAGEAGASAEAAAMAAPEPAVAAPAAAPEVAQPADAAAAATTPAQPAAAAVQPPVAPITPADAELRQRRAAEAALPAAPAAAPPAVSPTFATAPQPMPAMAPVPVGLHVAAAPAVHHQHQSWEDRGLTYLAVVLGLCIAALVIRKVLVQVFSFSSDDLYTFNHVEGVEL